MRAVFAVLLLAIVCPAHATWKPEYGKSPEAVRQWFKAAKTTRPAAARLHISRCCDDSERLRTKFEPSSSGEWSYYPNPLCISKGCPLEPIPNDVVHSDPIHALDPKDEALPEFAAMRREGVLFIYLGKPSCFWPPEPGI